MKERLAGMSSRETLADLIERLPSREAVARAVGLERRRGSFVASHLALIGSGVLIGSAITLMLAPMVRDRLARPPRSRYGANGRDREDSVLTEM